jgi:predicted phosphoribosyltransferase
MHERAFDNRTEAGRALARELGAVVAARCVVAPIPRGGVAVALPIIESLRAPLAMIYARKLTAPVAPELAFGAVDEDGEAIVEWTTVTMLGLAPSDVDAARKRVTAEIARRMSLYGAPPLARFLPGPPVVLVDDGLATGLTMRAAVAYARRHGATSITVAVPCASPEAVSRFRREADRVVALIIDPDFYAVGAYYEDFSPVSDADVVAMLARARQCAVAGSAPGAAPGLYP